MHQNVIYKVEQTLKRRTREREWTRERSLYLSICSKCVQAILSLECLVSSSAQVTWAWPEWAWAAARWRWAGSWAAGWDLGCWRDPWWRCQSWTIAERELTVRCRAARGRTCSACSARKRTRLRHTVHPSHVERAKHHQQGQIRAQRCCS